MARNISDIHNEILLAIAQKSELSGLNSTSKFSVYRLIAYCVAVSIWTLEKLFDLHQSEISNLLATQKPHTLRFYASTAKLFRFGDALNDSGEYVGEADENALIISEASASASGTNNSIILKVAKKVNNLLLPLSGTEKAAFDAYMVQVKDAGVKLITQSLSGDKFKIVATIYRDPLVLDSFGKRLDGTNDFPVRDAIQNYIQGLPYDGILITQKVVDAIQATEGVITVDLVSLECSRFDSNFSNAQPFYRTIAGYFDTSLSTISLTYQVIA